MDREQVSSNAPIHKPPPTFNSPPPEDTARYVAWMEKRGTPIDMVERMYRERSKLPPVGKLE